MSQLTLRLLGPPEVYRGETLLKFPTRKTLGLLIDLALAGSRRRREELTAYFWPDSDARRSRGSLRNTLGYLRTTLGPAANRLIIEPDTLAFEADAGVWLDTQLVQAAAQAIASEAAGIPTLQTAVEAYRGDFLAGFSLDDAPDFDDWAGAQREYWQRQIGRICDRLSQLQADDGQPEAALATATRWVALDGWNEAAHRRLMQTHFTAGDRSAALRAYEVCRKMLAEEFGVAPSPETESLAARIHRDDFGFAISDLRLEPSHPPFDALNPKSTPSVENLKFVGRTNEYSQLISAYYAAKRGQPHLAVLVGEAGIGKTRLVQEFLAWATTQGADILPGHAFESGGRLPYQPIVQALRNRLEQENAPEDLLSDVWLVELSRLLPELRDRYSDLPEPARDEAAARTRLFEAVTRLLLALAKPSPVILFLDDLHWADEVSLDLLGYAFSRWVETGASILTLLNLRRENLAAAPKLQDWLAGLNRQLPVTRLNLEALSLSDIQELVAALVGPAETFTHWLFAETGGQPFYLSELLKLLSERHFLRQEGESWQVDLAAIQPGQNLIPITVRNVIRTRLARLSEAAMALLTAAAVLGRETTFSYLCRIAQLDDSQGLIALDTLLSARLLAEAVSGKPIADPLYRFTHDKIREVVYDMAGEARRRIFHQRAFEMLANQAAPAILAHHALRAGLTAAAFAYSLAASDEAMRLFAVREAVTHYELARTLNSNYSLPAADLPHLYTQLGRAYELGDAWDQAKAVYETFLDYTRAIGQASMECLALNHLATVHIQGLFKLEQATALLQQALAIAAKNQDNLGLAETEWNLALVAQMDGQLQPAGDHAERALALARQAGRQELMARSLNVLAYINLRLRHWERVAACAEEARVYYAAAGDKALESDCLRQLGVALTFSGQPQKAIQALREAHTISLEIENRWGQADSLFHLAHALVEIGTYGEALQLAQQAVALCQTVKHPHLIILSLVILGKAQRAVLALEAARTTQLEALSAQQKAPSPIFPDWPLDELCAVCALSGDWATAQAYARQAWQLREKETLLPMALTNWLETEALLRGSDESLARAGVERWGSLIGDNRRYRIPYLRSLAVLAEWDGDGEQAITYLQEALTLAEQIGLPGEQWQIWAKLGALSEVIGDKDKAQAAFKQATEIAQALAARIDNEGLRTGLWRAKPIQQISSA
jgi:DNA-binding SARP family transcriptional activator